MWNLFIEKVENGYICLYQQEVEDGKFVPVKHVIPEKDDETEAMTELLYFVSEHFGFYYDKYKEKNLSVRWDKCGHKISIE